MTESFQSYLCELCMHMSSTPISETNKQLHLLKARLLCKLERTVVGPICIFTPSLEADTREALTLQSSQTFLCPPGTRTASMTVSSPQQ